MTNEQLGCFLEHLYRQVQNTLICLNNNEPPDITEAQKIISNLSDDLFRNMARLRG